MSDDDVNHMEIRIPDGKLYCPKHPDVFIDNHNHVFGVLNLLVDQCVVEGCHEQRFA